MLYECSDEIGENGSEIPGGGEGGDYLASCMQMTWFYVVNRKGT